MSIDRFTAWSSWQSEIDDLDLSAMSDQHIVSDAKRDLADARTLSRDAPAEPRENRSPSSEASIAIASG
jgi:hypothetical protein